MSRNGWLQWVTFSLSVEVDVLSLENIFKFMTTDTFNFSSKVRKVCIEPNLITVLRKIINQIFLKFFFAVSKYEILIYVLEERTFDCSWILKVCRRIRNLFYPVILHKALNITSGDVSISQGRDKTIKPINADGRNGS